MHVFIESAQRTPTRQAVSATPSLTQSIEISISATFGERIRRVWGLLPRHFSHDFRAQGVTLKSKAFGNKMYISDLITVIGYLHTVGF